MDNGQNIILPDEVIMNKIFLIRGKKVMLDRDLAGLYDVKAIRMREQVKRNKERFPENFTFQLTKKEADTMVSQNAIPSKKYLGGYLPYVFTEYGILMLANVIKSDRAIKMSIRIIEIFVRMHEMLSSHNEILQKLEKIEKKDIEQDKKILIIFKYLRQLKKGKQEELNDKYRKKIGFKIEKDKS
jgi:hypothetical protein